MLVSSSGPWASPEFVCTAPLYLSMGAWMHANRQTFITRSEVLCLKQKPSLDTNAPRQVNKDLGKEGGGGVGGGGGLEERRRGHHTCALFSSQSKMCKWTDSYSHIELRTEEWLLT